VRRGSAVHLSLGHVSHSSVQLHRLVDHKIAGVAGGVLGDAHGADVGFPGRDPEGEVASVGARKLGALPHFHQLVPHHLAGDQRPTEGLPVPRPLQGQVQAPLSGRVRLHGQGDALVLELLGDLDESGVLRADEVAHRDADVHIGQLAGV